MNLCSPKKEATKRKVEERLEGFIKQISSRQSNGLTTQRRVVQYTVRQSSSLVRHTATLKKRSEGEKTPTPDCYFAITNGADAFVFDAAFASPRCQPPVLATAPATFTASTLRCVPSVDEVPVSHPALHTGAACRTLLQSGQGSVPDGKPRKRSDNASVVNTTRYRDDDG